MAAARRIALCPPLWDDARGEGAAQDICALVQVSGQFPPTHTAHVYVRMWLVAADSAPLPPTQGAGAIGAPPAGSSLGAGGAFFLY